MVTKQATVKWLEQQRYVGIDGTDHAIVISSANEEGKIGVRPTDLLLLALGSCTAYDVVNILTKKRKKLTGLEVHVTGEQRDELPWAFTHFHIHYVVKGRGLTEKVVREAIELSDEKYCSVSATLKGGAEITFDFEIIEDEL
jgi:putative redox protein